MAIVCVGNNPVGVPDAKWGKVSVRSEGREAVDRKSITLEQEKLIKRVYAANSNTIVVLISSFPYAINWTQEHVPAIVHLTQNSEELGNALADVLFGDYNPGGPPGADLAAVARPVAADDGLQHSSRSDLYVFQRPAAVSIRLRVELHDL